MTDNYSDVSTKMYDMANETYKTFVKTVIWSQEKTLELTKLLFGQFDTYQSEGKGLLEEYTNQFQGVQRMFQGVWQEGVKNGVEMVNQYRAATNQNLTDLNVRLDAMQQKLESGLKVPA